MYEYDLIRFKSTKDWRLAVALLTFFLLFAVDPILWLVNEVSYQVRLATYEQVDTKNRAVTVVEFKDIAEEFSGELYRMGQLCGQGVDTIRLNSGHRALMVECAQIASDAQHKQNVTNTAPIKAPYRCKPFSPIYYLYGPTHSACVDIEVSGALFDMMWEKIGGVRK